MINKREGRVTRSKIVLQRIALLQAEQNPFSRAVNLADVVHCHPDVFTTSNYHVRIENKLEARPVTDFQAKMTPLQCNTPYRGHPINFHIWQQPMQRCST